MLLYSCTHYVQLIIFFGPKPLLLLMFGFVPNRCRFYVATQTFGRFFASMCVFEMFLLNNVVFYKKYVRFSNVKKQLANVEIEPQTPKYQRLAMFDSQKIHAACCLL